MIIRCAYPTQADIPENYRALFHQVGSQWVLNTSEIEGINAHVLPALEAHKQTLINEKATVEQRVQAANQRAATAESELANLKAPGTILLSPQDAKEWQRYTQLGDAKKLEAVVAEHTTLKSEVAENNREKGIREAAKAAGFNADVLASEMKLRGAGAELFTKVVNVKDAQGKETPQAQAFVRTVTTNAAGQQQINEQPFLEYTAANPNVWPDYVVKALTTSGQQQQQQQQQTAPALPKLSLPGAVSNHQPGGVVQPAGGLDINARLKSFNESRNLPQGQQAPAPAQ